MFVFLKCFLPHSEIFMKSANSAVQVLVLTLSTLWTWLIYRWITANFIHYHRYNSLPWWWHKLCLFMSPYTCEALHVSYTWSQALTCTTVGVRRNILYLQVSSKLCLLPQYCFGMKNKYVLARIKASCYKIYYAFLKKEHRRHIFFLFTIMIKLSKYFCFSSMTF